MRVARLLILLLVLAGCAPILFSPSDPDQAQFITSDIERFWKAYDLALNSPDPAGVFQKEYLEGGSRGLQDFAPSRIGNADLLARTVKAGRRYYESIRATTLGLARDETLKNQIRQNFRALKAIYPEARFADTYFLIGRFTSGGTVGLSGILIGSEFSTKTPDSPLEELNPWVRANLRTVSEIPFLVTHELVHTLQGLPPSVLGLPTTLLNQAMREGSADFLAALASGERPSGPYFAYGLQNEKALWAEFEREMNGTDLSRWLYQGDQSVGRPADLGYFIGYRISESYYNQAKDQRQAVRDILQLNNVNELLAKSRYGENLQAR